MQFSLSVMGKDLGGAGFSGGGKIRSLVLHVKLIYIIVFLSSLYII